MLQVMSHITYSIASHAPSTQVRLATEFTFFLVKLFLVVYVLLIYFSAY